VKNTNRQWPPWRAATIPQLLYRTISLLQQYNMSRINGDLAASIEQMEAGAATAIKMGVNSVSLLLQRRILLLPVFLLG
jgi:hypothetical protein